MSGACVEVAEEALEGEPLAVLAAHILVAPCVERSVVHANTYTELSGESPRRARAERRA